MCHHACAVWLKAPGMTAYVVQILDRGERLELLVNKTDNLQSDSLVFRKQSRQLRRKVWWQSARMLVLMFLVLAVALFLVVTGICGIRLRQCRH